MLSTEKLLELLQDLESDRIEKTISTTDTNKFCEAICAFSNDFPNSKKNGYLITLDVVVYHVKVVPQAYRLKAHLLHR
jgi:hypothetical protein